MPDEKKDPKHPSPPVRRRRVALLVETSLGSGREILRGIARYARENAEWQLFHAAGGLSEAIPDWLETWQGDAVVARIRDRDRVEALAALGIPVVDVLGGCETPFPLVHVDDARIGALVAQYLLDRDYLHLAFYGIEGENWSRRRADAFLGKAAKMGGAASLHQFHSPRRRISPTAEFRALRDWVAGLPRPAGVMVCSDQRGLELMEACRALDIAVPEEIAVVGVDNDLALCELSDPPLSSVRGGHFRVGFEAARLVDCLLAGHEPPPGPLLAPPNGIVERESSSLRAIRDPAVAKGVQYLRERLAESLTNESIARAAGLSRTVFQQRFRAAMGHSIREYILLRRVERARLLIETTDITLAEVAERSGFKHQEYLGQIVKKLTGETPGQMRKRAREAGAEGAQSESR